MAPSTAMAKADGSRSRTRSRERCSGRPSGPGNRQGRTGRGGSRGIPGRTPAAVAYEKRVLIVATENPGRARAAARATRAAQVRATSGEGTRTLMRGQRRSRNRVSRPIARSPHSTPRSNPERRRCSGGTGRTPQTGASRSRTSSSRSVTVAMER